MVGNKYYARKRNVLIHAGSYGFSLSKLTLSPIVLYVLPFVFVCYLSIIYVKLTLEEREKAFQHVLAVLKQVFPRVVVVVFIFALCFWLQSIFTQIASAAILRKNSYSHKLFPVQLSHARRWLSRSRIYTMSDNPQLQNDVLQSVRNIQKFFPFISDTILETLVNYVVISPDQQTTRFHLDVWRAAVQAINTSYYGPSQSYGRLLLYKEEILLLLNNTVISHVDIGIRSQIIDLLNKIKQYPVSVINHQNHLQPFQDTEALYKVFIDFRRGSSFGRDRMKVFIQVCQLVSDYVPGQFYDISKAVYVLNQCGFLAKDLVTIIETSVKNTSTDQIAARINQIIRNAIQTSIPNIPPDMDTLDRSVSTLATIIANSLVQDPQRVVNLTPYVLTVGSLVACMFIFQKFFGNIVPRT